MQNGQRIRDYVLDRKLGEGGMGEVWSARHTVLQRPVAIKVMARQLAADPQFEERFLREARAQATLHHPRILGVTEFFSDNGIHYLVMPLVQGETLAQRLERTSGPLPLPQALAIARDVLDALDYAHQRGIIHRDVKPSNILLDRNGHPFLLDFGIALPVGQHRLTRTGVAMGSSAYISPEQIRNPKNIDHRTDVYSFGCVLFEMLAGRPPFVPNDNQSDTDFALKQAHMTQAPLSLRHFNATVPPAVEVLVLRSLQKDPDRRFGGCGEFRRALDSGNGSAAVPAFVARDPQPSLGGFQTSRSPRKSRVSILGFATVVGVVLLLVILGALYGKKRGNQAAEETPVRATPSEPPPPVPQAESSDPVHKMLGEISQKLAETYDKTGDYYDALAPSGIDNVTAELVEGKTYIAAAVCDRDCSDLDLSLVDSNGTVIAKDVLADDNPIVQAIAPYSGKFALHLAMEKCSAASCQYGVGLYQKR